MTNYGKLLESNGAALLANTIGIFAHLPGTTFPKDVYQSLLNFTTKAFNLQTRTASKALKVVASEAKLSVLMQANIGWNPLYREPESGEILAGVLLQIRITLYKANAKDLERSRLLRVSCSMLEFLGFAKSNLIAASRMAWNSNKLTESNYSGFEEDWYPTIWMVLSLCGLPAGNQIR